MAGKVMVWVLLIIRVNQQLHWTLSNKLSGH
jgi:hypothetical protein